MKNRLFKRLGSLAVAGMMFVCYPLAASAEQYDIRQGNISVLASFENGQTKYKVNGNDVDGTEIEITGYNGGNVYYVEITSGNGASALIRFKDLYIDNSTVSDGFAVITGGDGKVEIELDGDNKLKAGENRAGLQKGNAGLLVIKDADGTAGKLAVAGGDYGAGIGGGNNQSVNNIVIEGGTITATGGDYGAGIGGGGNGSGTVTIEKGTVEATGGENGAGIGGGVNGSGTVIISGGSVTATGVKTGAGIGGGDGGSGTVTISGGTVEAAGGKLGAGIGGGDGGSGMVTIEEGTVEATGGEAGAGIGGGYEGSGTVTISGGDVTATGGDSGAGIGGGREGSGTVIIEKGTVEATGGDYGAGIGGGREGSGTVTIEKGAVEATGGDYGAGIGGGTDATGTVIINGGTVEATGRYNGAGIGGGDGESGTVTISGGTVVAVSKISGAGIGGGYGSSGSTITVSGSANVSARGGKEFSGYGSGAAIGEGGKDSLVAGTEVTPDVSGLYTTGSITTYAVGTDIDDIKQGTAWGNTIVGTVPVPDTNTDTTTPEEPKVNEPKAEEPKIEEPKIEEPKIEEPKIEEPPVYTERSCVADVDVAALVGALLSSDASASTLNIEFEDNICLNPEIMTALFADNRVAKNCFFWHKGKRYVLHIGAVNKQSALYTEDFAELAEEPDGLAGFMMMAKIFADLGVTLSEIQE